MRRLIILSLIILCASYTNSPVQAETVNKSVKLLADFKSFQTIEGTNRYCNSLGFQWLVIEDSHLPEGDRRPRFDIFVVEIKGYAHLNQLGTLRLAFFNDRLSEIRFYPNSIKKYLEILIEKEKLDLINKKEHLFNNVRVWLHEKWGNPYIGWSDIRLEQEEFEWIKQYS